MGGLPLHYKCVMQAGPFACWGKDSPRVCGSTARAGGEVIMAFGTRMGPTRRLPGAHYGKYHKVSLQNIGFKLTHTQTICDRLHNGVAGGKALSKDRETRN